MKRRTGRIDDRVHTFWLSGVNRISQAQLIKDSHDDVFRKHDCTPNVLRSLDQATLLDLSRTLSLSTRLRNQLAIEHHRDCEGPQLLDLRVLFDQLCIRVSQDAQSPCENVCLSEGLRFHVHTSRVLSTQCFLALVLHRIIQVEHPSLFVLSWPVCARDDAA